MIISYANRLVVDNDLSSEELDRYCLAIENSNWIVFALNFRDLSNSNLRRKLYIYLTEVEKFPKDGQNRKSFPMPGAVSYSNK